MEQWMDYRHRLIRKFIHCFGAKQPRGKIGLSYSLGLWDFIFSCQLYVFPCSRISSFLLFLCLLNSCCSHVKVFGKTLVHEFLISYSHTELYLIFSDSATTSAHCVFGSSEKLEMDMCTSKPIPPN